MFRVLVVDESLDKRLATELEGRGFAAASAASLNLLRKNDEFVLNRLAKLQKAWVLVTADDAMPEEHNALIRQIHATIATIDGEWERVCTERGLRRTQEEFKRDSVHRWAHIMAEQEAGSVMRYTPFNRHEWRPRTRLRGIARPTDV